MAKDPAFLFYSNDFISGTYTMTNEQVGKYIRLLCLQHQKGSLTKKDMLYICKSYDKDIFDKFAENSGIYTNTRLKDESEKRKSYSESRRKNRLGNEQNNILPLNHSNKVSESYVQHMENENVIINKDKNDKVFDFEKVWELYPRKEGKKDALRHFKATIKTETDYNNLIKAINNYSEFTEKRETEHIKQGGTFFNNWSDYVNFNPQKKPIEDAYR